MPADRPRTLCSTRRDNNNRSAEIRPAPKELRSAGEKISQARPPAGFRSKPAVGRIAEKFRRIKWRDVIAKKIILSLKRRPRGIDDESRQSEKNEQRLRPPNVGAHRLAE